MTATKDHALPTDGPAVPEQRRRADPIDELARDVRSVAVHAVDRFEVAASLESSGITDGAARVRYGCSDVFLLADQVLRRSGPRPAAEPAPVPARPHWATGLRDIGHGVLYLLPAAVFPVGLAIVGGRGAVVCMLVLGGIGWVWAGGSAWLAYRLQAREAPAAVARVLGTAAVLGVVVALAAGTVLTLALRARTGVVGLGVGQMAFQMAATLLMFYRREELLYRAMAAGVLAGLAWIGGLLPLSVAAVVVVASLTAAFALAIRLTVQRMRGRSGQLAVWPGGTGVELGGLPVVVLYTALSAVYLLFAQSRFLSGELGVLMGFLPLFVGMGFVEWRSRRFTDEGRELLARVRYPRDHADQVRRMLVRDISLCAVAVAVPALVLLDVLMITGSYRPAAAVLCGTGVVLSGANLIGFLMANLGRYRDLCLCLAAAIGLHVLLVVALAPTDPMTEALIFAISAVLLHLLLLAAFYLPLSRARTFQ